MCTLLRFSYTCTVTAVYIDPGYRLAVELSVACCNSVSLTCDDDVVIVSSRGVVDCWMCFRRPFI